MNTLAWNSGSNPASPPSWSPPSRCWTNSPAPVIHFCQPSTGPGWPMCLCPLSPPGPPPTSPSPFMALRRVSLLLVPALDARLAQQLAVLLLGHALAALLDD